MSLIEIKAEPGLLKQLLKVLGQIAAALDRAYPPPPDPELRAQMKPTQAEAMWEFDEEAEYRRELEEEARGQTRHA